MSDNEEFPYPMWAMICDDCGFVGTLWENPGTGASYVEHCVSCGGQRVETKRIEDKTTHKQIASGIFG